MFQAETCFDSIHYPPPSHDVNHHLPTLVDAELRCRPSTFPGCCHLAETRRPPVQIWQDSISLCSLFPLTRQNTNAWSIMILRFCNVYINVLTWIIRNSWNHRIPFHRFHRNFASNARPDADLCSRPFLEVIPAHALEASWHAKPRQVAVAAVEAVDMESVPNPGCHFMPFLRHVLPAEFLKARKIQTLSNTFISETLMGFASKHICTQGSKRRGSTTRGIQNSHGHHRPHSWVHMLTFPGKRNRS